ncbi:unnamed protein product [Diabrotica balteata]|uniref:Myb/SANT-like DNA-binding domain-containing protein n=1 Tax=Diabrotica balteata TaxID=107213 RepID=A0A9N9XIF5_DIABA|nr:unnamed protein product [Diabrotica balteata]
MSMLKVNTTFCGEFIKKAEEVEILERKYFQTKNKVIDVTTDLKYWFEVYVKNVVLTDLSEFEESQSGWAQNKIISLEININKFEMAKVASSYIQLHPKVARKRACINVRNNDQACFAWAIVSALYSVNINTNKTSSYPHYTNVLNLKGLTFPVTLNQIPLIEKNNENISVNVFELNVKDEDFNFSVLPVRLTKQKREKHVNLLIVQNKYYFNNKADSIEPWSDGHDEDIIHFHYIWIKDLDLYLKLKSKVGTLEIKYAKILWLRIAEELNSVGITATPNNCLNRWRVLERNYNKLVDNQKKTGRGRKYFEYEKEMDQIFGNKKNVNPEILLSSDTYHIIEEKKQDIDEGVCQNTEHIEEIPCTQTPKTPIKRLRNKNSELQKMRTDRANYYQERLPFSLVHDEAFVKLLRELEPEYKLPSRNTVVNVLLEEQYQSIKNSLERVKKITKMELYTIVKDFKGNKIEEKFSLLEERLAQLTSCSSERNVFTRSLKYFKTSFKKRWSLARNTDRRLLENNMEWLNVSLELPTWTHKAGRLTKEFGELCEQRKYTPQGALALFMEGNFTRRQWELIQGGQKEIYPWYSILQKAKEECYPADDSIQVTETSFAVEFQALLNHTALRLLQYLTEVVDTLSEFEKQHLTLILTWVCDGSNQTKFKQKFGNTDDDDANIFLSSLVPVRIVVSVNRETRKIISQNPVPSSVRFCRSSRARFIHETKDVTKEEIT